MHDRTQLLCTVDVMKQIQLITPVVLAVNAASWMSRILRECAVS